MRERESSSILSSLDAVVREKRERKKRKEKKKEKERELWYVLEFGGSGREKIGKKGKKKVKKKRAKVHVWRTQKGGKKEIRKK